MSTYEIISTILSTVAVVVAVLTYMRNKKGKDDTKK